MLTSRGQKPLLRWSFANAATLSTNCAARATALTSFFRNQDQQSQNRRFHERLAIVRTDLGRYVQKNAGLRPPDLRYRRLQYSTKSEDHTGPIVHDIFEPKTGSWQYVVADPTSSMAAIIDPVLDYDASSQVFETTTADALLAIISNNGYQVSHILETHAHADHITAASYLQRELETRQGARPSICIGSRIDQVQKHFSARYSVSLKDYGIVFDKLLGDDEEIYVGSLRVTAMHIPGHTPDHLGYRIGDNVFAGDLIFHKDLGTARADFPGGSAIQVYQSARRLLSLPGHIRIYSGHDYPTESRRAVSHMTVDEHRAYNKHLMDGMSEEEFVKMRQARDATLDAPRLIDQSLQMNIRGGKLPLANDSGQRSLYIPLKMNNFF